MDHRFNPNAPLLCRYNVNYASGLEQYPNLITGITLDLYDNGFLLWGNKNFQNLWIPHGAVLDFKLSTGYANAWAHSETSDFVREKMINIRYYVTSCKAVTLRLEMEQSMWSGRPNYIACQQLLKIMKQNHIFEKFACAEPSKQQEMPTLISQRERRMGELNKKNIFAEDHRFNPNAPLLCRYRVNYISGLTQYPDLITEIAIDLYDNGFLILGNDEFQSLWIPYGAVLDFKLSTGYGSDWSIYNVADTIKEKIINIRYRAFDHQIVDLVLEMAITRISANVNYNGCEQLIAIMKKNHIFEKFACAQPPKQQEMPDIISQIERLGELHKAGILTDAEFESKKAELLKRL